MLPLHATAARDICLNTGPWDYLRQLLTTRGLLENTLVIATADHGEVGTSHGGLRQKNFNFYEESIRVPLVYSNPHLCERRYKLARERCLALA
jgi:arylsulfatase A-like enzyme